MATVKVVFFLPLRDNDGRDLQPERSDVEDELYLRFLSWTQLGIVQGAYRMAGGAKAVDEHRAYALLLDEILVAGVEDVLRRFKARTTRGDLLGSPVSCGDEAHLTGATMTDREQIEAEIRAVLLADLDAVTLSNRLYAQGTGLFVRLGDTPEERRRIVQSDLWKTAQARVRELERRDLERFREVVRKVEEHRPAGTFTLQLGVPQPVPAK